MTYQPQEGIDYIVNLYAVAGAEQGATEPEIKTALNDRAKEYHPDRLQGLAPEFQEKGERIAKLLNRARGILLDTDKRTAYDEILTTWDGPVSTDGTPVVSIARLQEVQLQGKTPEEVEAMFAEQVEQIAGMTGYRPSRLSFLEKMVEQADDDVADELRDEYEDALLQKDRALAIEEAERSRALGLPDIQEQNYTAALGYGEETAAKLTEARAKKEANLQLLALGGVGAKLALLTGEVTEPSASLVTESPMSLELPAYYGQQAARVQQIANERDAITDKRLENLVPIYPEAELQAELKGSLIIGVATSKGHYWLGAKLNIEQDSADFQQVGDEVKALLNQGDYAAVIARGHGVVLVKPMEHIDIQDLLGVAIGKYTDKYKPRSQDL
jgi:curved DNA-binding protein CbpA